MLLARRAHAHGSSARLKVYGCVLLVVVLAFVQRLWFIRAGLVVNPMIGDAVQYCDYAWNLVQSHVFSLSPPGSENVVPDNYRDPGYPLFLAAWLVLWGSGDPWYHAVLFVQAVLGALSAGVAMLTAMQWLGLRIAFFVGMAVALWPHSVSISGFLLSETLFGFVVLVSIGFLAMASRSASKVPWAIAGLSFGAASLVNATLTPFCPLLAVVLMARRAAPRPLLLTLMIASLVMPLAWSARTRILPDGPSAGSRVMTNLVQGSWADYHSAYIKALFGDVPAKAVMSDMDSDIALAVKSPEDWLSVLATRIRQDPVHYIAWYAWKPYLLWAWNIRVGAGDVYPYPVAHPIYRTYLVMRLFESICAALNPLLFALMVGGVWIVLTRPAKSAATIALYAMSALIAYETLVYSLLQAEPRYSIPFRPLEIMLAATAMTWIVSFIQKRRTASGRVGDGSGDAS